MNQPDPEPTAPPPPELSAWESMREWYDVRKAGLSSHRPFAYWLLTRGLVSIAAVTVVVVLSGFIDGWWDTYELLIGDKSPRGGVPVLSFVVSVGGWVLVPALIGAVGGYAVESAINRHRKGRLR